MKPASYFDPTDMVCNEEDRDIFAMSFCVWLLCDPIAQGLIAAKVTAYSLLQHYKDRPYLDQDTSKQ